MKINSRLYLVTDRKLCAHRIPLAAAVEEALKGGVRAVQLREKDLPTRELLDLAYRMRELTAAYQAMLYINDRVDIALCVGADGVHLGRSSLPVHAVRRIVGSGCVIGASTHTLEEALAAEGDGADFITFGPLYDTPSKRGYGEPVGLASLHEVKEKVSLPIFGIGGITAERVRDVVNAGAYGIALISGILGDRDIAGAARNYLRMLA